MNVIFPREILYIIINKCDIYHKYKTISLVCKNFYNIVQNINIYNNYKFIEEGVCVYYYYILTNVDIRRHGYKKLYLCIGYNIKLKKIRKLYKFKSLNKLNTDNIIMNTGLQIIETDIDTYILEKSKFYIGKCYYKCNNKFTLFIYFNRLNNRNLLKYITWNNIINNKLLFNKYKYIEFMSDPINQRYINNDYNSNNITKDNFLLAYMNCVQYNKNITGQEFVDSTKLTQKEIINIFIPTYNLNTQKDLYNIKGNIINHKSKLKCIPIKIYT